MRVASRKAKGRKLQQLVREMVLGVSPTFRPEDVKSTPMGVTGEDVQLSPFVRDVLPIQIECKNTETVRPPIYQYLEQAGYHGKHEPVVVHKMNYKKPVVIVDAEHYFSLWKRIIEYEKDL